MRLQRRVGVTILFLVLIGATFVLSPDPRNESNATAVESNGISSPADAGLRVFIDPETGEVSDGVDPNAVVELDGETENALRHDDDGLTTIRHADGSESLDLQGRFQEASVVQVDENGKRTFCQNSAEAIERALNDKTPTSTTPEVK